MVIGGIAVIARGVRRFTTDIGAAIRGDEIEIAPSSPRLRPRTKSKKPAKTNR